jgi:hypothetical protein
MEQQTDFQKLYFEGMTKLMNAQFINVHEKLDEIITHQKEINGRVRTLEKETAVFRWASRNPIKAIILATLIIAGFITVGVFLGYDTILKALI